MIWRIKGAYNLVMEAKAKPPICIIILGMAGSGKSTFISVFNPYNDLLDAYKYTEVSRKESI